MKDSLACKLRHLVPVHYPKRRVAANIKRLEEVGDVRRHAEGDNLVILAELIKFWCCVAAATVKDKQSICALRVRLRVSIKVLHPLNTKVISHPSIVPKRDNPVLWEVLIPSSLVELAR
jgi:hypothetical protein